MEPFQHRAVTVTAVGYLTLGAWATLAPAHFAAVLANFGSYNPHLIRDFGVCALTFGTALAVAVVQREWWRPALLMTALWSALHAANHWADAATADPPWIGWSEASLLTIVAGALALLARGTHDTYRADAAPH